MKTCDRTLKQQRERAEFNNFLRVRRLSFEHFYSADEPEPDIVAIQGNERFGIEVTNFHRQAAKRRESEEDRVVDLARLLHVESGGPNLCVDVTWAPHYEIRKQARNELASKLVSLVRQNIPEPGMVVHLDWRNFSTDLMSAIADVFVDRSLKLSGNHWFASGGGVVPDWDIATLQNEIDKNNSKPKRYAHFYTETWLLIVSSFGAPSAWMEMTDEVKQNAFRTTFHRVFLLSSFPLDAFELRVHPLT